MEFTNRMSAHLSITLASHAQMLADIEVCFAPCDRTSLVSWSQILQY